MPKNTVKLGLWFAVSAYFMWGLFPLYFKSLQTVPGLQILCHRIIWSALLLSVILAIQKDASWILALRQDKKKIALFFCSALMISTNWGIYIWAVNDNHVLEASLGYFIQPLFNVLLGRIFFREKLSQLQLVAFSCAIIGVLWLTYLLGHLPWRALGIAASFGFYGLLRKKVDFPAVAGLAIETYLLLPFALLGLVWYSHLGQNVFMNAELDIQLLLIGCGVVTTVPLLLFAGGLKRLDLTTMGLIQYITPTLQFLLGWLFFKEAFDGLRFIGYAWIWLGLGIYTLGLLVRNYQK